MDPAEAVCASQRKEIFPVSCSNHCHSGCGCNSCGTSLSCCNSCSTLRTRGCGCNSCNTLRTNNCGCNSCNTLRANNCGCGCGCNNWGCNSCGSCATARVSGCHCNSCNSCSGNFGLLRTVSGPFVRSGCCSNNWSFPFFTGPCGPCNARSGCNGSRCLSGTSCNDCGCNNCGCNNCGCNNWGWNNCGTLRASGCGCNNCGCNNCGCDNCCDDCGCDDCNGLAILADDCDECHVSASFAANTPVELAAGDAVELSPTFASTDDFTASQEGVRIHRPGDYLAVYTVHVPANQVVSSRFLLTLDGARIEASAQDVATVADYSTNGYTMHAMFHAEEDSLLKLVSLNPVSICGSSASNVFTLSLTRIP